MVVKGLNFFKTVSRIAPNIFITTKQQTEINWQIYVAGLLILIYFKYVFIKTKLGFLANGMIDRISIE
jgi:hypothetical protein